MEKEEQSPVRVAYERRNRDLDPQLVWRGKDEQDWSRPRRPGAAALHPGEGPPQGADRRPAARRPRERRARSRPSCQLDLFADFNGIPKGVDKTEFYQHDQNWSNRMILGDCLQVMASLAEREGLRGKVQCIYIDPPYGIKFNSNFQWSTTSRDVKDGNADHITREPEQVKAFRDTWRDGIHTYLTYLRDRLTVARDLLTDSGSIFVQIGDENVHRVRALMDEVFGEDNFVAQITFRRQTGAASAISTGTVNDYMLWYAKSKRQLQSTGSSTREAIAGDRLRWITLQLAIETVESLTSAQRRTGSALAPDCPTLVICWTTESTVTSGGAYVRFRVSKAETSPARRSVGRPTRRA